MERLTEGEGTEGSAVLPLMGVNSGMALSWEAGVGGVGGAWSIVGW